SFTSTPTLTTATSNAVTITAGVASKLAIATQPSTTAQSGIAFGTQPIIQIRDASDNVVITDNTTTVTAAIASGGGTLATTLTVTASSGIATFSGLKITPTIRASKLSFTSTPTLTTATSNAVTITAGVASKVNVETAANG